MNTITQKQAKILKRKGIAFDPNISRHHAGRLVKLAIQSASPRTRRRLDAFGLEYDPYVSQADAYAMLNKHHAKTRDLYNRIEDEAGSLFDLASQSIDWRRMDSGYAQGDCPICFVAGKRGSNSFYVSMTENVGGCRDCNWEKNGQGRGPVGFYANMNNLEWFEAVYEISDANVPRVAPKTALIATHKPKNDAQWRNKWEGAINGGQTRLEGPSNRTREYLEKRGIAYATMQAFGVASLPYAYPPHSAHACILFPYHDNDGRLRAVNRRVSADVADNKCRFASGSQKREAFFGVPSSEGLTWVIEGEINAMSAWQVLQMMGRSDSVLSVSSESDIKARSKEFADRWGADVVVWCDKQWIADVAREHGIAAWATKQDANDLLLAGKLMDCLSWMAARMPW